MMVCLFYIVGFGIGWGIGMLIRQNLKKDGREKIQKKS